MTDRTADRPTISVVIPVKDDGPELRRCLRALAAQTLAPDEIVVVDNGSSDTSAAIAGRAGARVIRCPEPGIPAASARGYDTAAGEIILRLDADCVPDPRWVETVADAFERHPRTSAFTGGARFVDGPRPLRSALAVAYLGAYALLLIPALGHLPLFGSNLALRRVAWLDVRGSVHRHDPNVHDDLDLAFHLGERHRIRLLPSAAMGMSMRPFGDARSFARRLHRGSHSVLMHWPQDFPPVRWTRLILRRTLHRLGIPTPGGTR